MTNKEYIYGILCLAANSEHIIRELRDNLENIYGEDYLIVKTLDEAIEGINISQLFYDLGFGHSPEAESEDRSHFLEWLDDPRHYGPCAECAHRRPEDSDSPFQGFTRCTIHGGHCTPDYGCYEFLPEDNQHEQEAHS